MPTLCHLIASNFLGGPEKQILCQSVRLRALGWDVVIGSFRERRPSVGIIEAASAEKIATFVIDTNSNFSPFSIGQLQGQLAGRKIDVLVTHGYKSNLIGYLATRMVRTLQIPMIRGYTAENHRIKLYEEIDRLVLKRFGKILCVSEATGRMLSEAGISRERIAVIRNAVDLETGITALDPRAAFSLPADAFVAVAVGRLSPEKGQKYLIDAMSVLRSLSPPVHVVILGSGPEESSLRERVRTNRLEDRVLFAGFRADAVQLIAGADLLVNPSLTEGLPNVVLEALSVGTPVVATDVGGVSELIRAGETGWLVRAEDASALAEAILGALQDPDRGRTIAGKAMADVAERFSFSEQARVMDEYLRGAIASRGGDPRRRSGSPA